MPRLICLEQVVTSKCLMILTGLLTISYNFFGTYLRLFTDSASRPSQSSRLNVCVCMDIYVYICICPLPMGCFGEAFHWPSDHMISSRRASNWSPLPPTPMAALLTPLLFRSWSSLIFHFIGPLGQISF